MRVVYLYTTVHCIHISLLTNQSKHSHVVKNQNLKSLVGETNLDSYMWALYGIFKVVTEL